VFTRATHFAHSSLCATTRMWVRHRSVVIVPLEGGLIFRWDSEMCWCFIHVTIKLVSGMTPRSVIESCITHVSEPPPHEKQFRGRCKRRGFSHTAVARPLERNRAREDSVKRGLPSDANPPNSGPVPGLTPLRLPRAPRSVSSWT